MEEGLSFGHISTIDWLESYVRTWDSAINQVLECPPRFGIVCSSNKWLLIADQAKIVILVAETQLCFRTARVL
jgi:hypothetical protein